MARVVNACLGVVLLVNLAACAGARPPKGADLPDDFALSITVLPQKNDPAAMAPAWYVLGPDGVLHAALGERLVTSSAPPAVRSLSREQVRHVWELVVAGGLAEPRPVRMIVPDAQAGAPGAAAIVYVSALGRRRSFAVPKDQGAGVEPVVAEMRRLGWVPEEASKVRKPEERGSAGDDLRSGREQR